MLLIGESKEPEADEWEEDKEEMAKLVAILPGRDLARISLLTEVVDATVQPVTIGVDMELFKVTEFVQRMMLEVVGFDLIIFGGLGLISISIVGNCARRIVWVVVLRVVARMIVINISIRLIREGGLLAGKYTLPPTLH